MTCADASHRRAVLMSVHSDLFTWLTDKTCKTLIARRVRRPDPYIAPNPVGERFPRPMQDLLLVNQFVHREKGMYVNKPIN